MNKIKIDTVWITLDNGENIKIPLQREFNNNKELEKFRADISKIKQVYFESVKDDIIIFNEIDEKAWVANFCNITKYPAYFGKDNKTHISTPFNGKYYAENKHI